MLVFLNGKFVPEKAAVISIFDRSFCLADGLFEAISVYNGKPFLWEKHFTRFQSGAAFLKIKMPFALDAIRAFADELIQRNDASDAVLRLQLSRGVGSRGYSIRGADSPTFVMSVHPFPRDLPVANVVTSSMRILSNDPLAQFKTCNKLPHILARAEADERGADEALLLNTDGKIAEATSANFFWLEGDTVCTPPISSGALPGITRGVVLELCDALKISCVEKNIAPNALLKCGGAFLTSIAAEIREVAGIDECSVPRSPITLKLQKAFSEYVARLR